MAIALTEPSWLELAIAPLAQVKAAVFGDFCLDAYWMFETANIELSVETGLPVRRVHAQQYSLGGAGNVVANLVDLGVGRVQAIGVVGTDLFGGQLLRLLEDRGIKTHDSMVVDPAWQTMVYAKPCADGIEQNRIDFGAYNALSDKTIDALIGALDEAASDSDVVILNQQVPSGVSDQRVIERINAIIAHFARTHFVVDARHRPNLYRGAVLKLNVQEAGRFLGIPPDTRFSAEAVRNLARRISQKTDKPVFLTRGEHGIVAADGENVYETPGIQVLEDIDPVGAGDTAVAALAAVLGANQPPSVAAQLANIAATITVRKLRTTGTATPEEILAVGPEPDYIFEAELAEAPHLARYLEGTEIELIGDLPGNLQIEHCIFDHDGTLSTLREGWEKIMEPMMVREILGPIYATAAASLFVETTEKVRRFIDRTTGIQTLVQMKGLVDLVSQAGYVGKNEILDEHEYKQIFNRELMQMVQRRIDRLGCGELDSTDFQIKNARALLEELHKRGVKLYLASGTDEEDVIAEAKAMGYADLFEGRIFGAVGDIKTEAKRMVLERIMRDYTLAGHQFATFGDGPVEIRETRKRGGFCIGVASDELRRFGWNLVKRTRLIRAGASVVVPDYSQLTALLKVLNFA
jgi:rfaE bifunctional protein kinase chain/domain